MNELTFIQKRLQPLTTAGVHLVYKEMSDHEVWSRQVCKCFFFVMNDRDDLSTRDTSVAPKVSLVRRFHCMCGDFPH